MTSYETHTEIDIAPNETPDSSAIVQIFAPGCTIEQARQDWQAGYEFMRKDNIDFYKALELVVQMIEFLEIEIMPDGTLHQASMPPEAVYPYNPALFRGFGDIDDRSFIDNWVNILHDKDVPVSKADFDLALQQVKHNKQRGLPLDALTPEQEAARPPHPLLVWLRDLDLASAEIKRISTKRGVRSNGLRRLYNDQAHRQLRFHAFTDLMAVHVTDPTVPLGAKVKTTLGNIFPWKSANA